MRKTFTKDPDAVLDYIFDWAGWLAEGETIVTHDITATTGLTIDSFSATDKSVTVWLSGGVQATRYTVGCRLSTSAGRTDERTFLVDVRER